MVLALATAGAGGAGRDAQSQNRPVFPGLPAAVRWLGSRSGHRATRCAWSRLCGHERVYTALIAQAAGRVAHWLGRVGRRQGPGAIISRSGFGWR